MGHRLSGVICIHFGEFLAAREHLEQALARFDPAHRLFYASFDVSDPLVALLFISSGTCIVSATPIRLAPAARRRSRRRENSATRTAWPTR